MENSINQTMKQLLIHISNNVNRFEINYPNFGKVNVQIISIDLTNNLYKPIKVKILDNNLFKDDFIYVDDDSFGADTDTQIKKIIKVKWTEELCCLDWFENIN